MDSSVNVQEDIMMPVVLVTSMSVPQTHVSTVDVKMVLTSSFVIVLQDMVANDVTLILMNVDQTLVNMEEFAPIS
jgi:hypothetical protein